MASDLGRRWIEGQARSAFKLFDDLDHRAGLRIDEHALFVDDHITVIGLIGDRLDLDRVRKRRTDCNITFKRERWRLLLNNIGSDLAGNDDRRCLRRKR